MGYDGTINEAREYDIYGHPYTQEQDCTFLKQAFQSYHGNVREALDLACGTGRHALILAKDGYDVTGVDNSEGMITVAAEKASAEGLHIKWVQADVCEMEFSAQFDAAYILFNTMQCLTTNDELIRFMGGVHAVLRPGGVFVIEVGNRWPSIANGEFKSSISSWESGVEAEGIRQVRDTTLTVSPINNLYHVSYHERRWREEQELEPRDSAWTMRIFSLNELDLLARLTRFEILDVFGAMDFTRKIEDPHVVSPMENPPGPYVLVLRKLS